MYALKGYCDLNGILDRSYFCSEINFNKRQDQNQLLKSRRINYGNLSKEELKNLEYEVNVLSKVIHPHIVPVGDIIWETESSTLIVQFELSSGGDLGRVIEQSKKSGIFIDEKYIWKALVDVCKALLWVHSALPKFHLLHQDIKPSNIFIDEFGNFRLANFGFINNGHLKKDYIKGVPPHYSTPEMFCGEDNCVKSDIWNLGCLIYEMCCLEKPFLISNSSTKSRVKTGRLTAPIPHCYSKDLWDVIRFMLIVKCENRPTVEMVLYHPLVFLNFHVSDVRKGLVKEAKRSSIKEHIADPFNDIIQDIQNISFTKREPEEITESVFQEKWQSCLEVLRKKEADAKNREILLKDKEVTLHAWEQSLVRKEKYLKILERNTQENVTFTEMSRRCRKGKLSESFFDNITDISADNGEPDGPPTSTRLDPRVVMRPNFNNWNSHPITKHVHFQADRKEIISSCVPIIKGKSKEKIKDLKQNNYKKKSLKDSSKKYELSGNFRYLR